MPAGELRHDVFFYLFIRVHRWVDSYPSLGIFIIDLGGGHKNNLMLSCVQFIADDHLVAIPRKRLASFGNEQRGIGLELYAT